MKKLTKPVSIVMVAYNESGHIKKVIEQYYKEIYLKLPKGSEYIIYLDVPTDNTPKIVNQLATKIKIKVIMGKNNLGYAGAMTTALKSAKNDIVFYSDSSGKHIAKDFWNLIKFEDKFDIITGKRVSKGNPLIRQILTIGQKFIISLLFFVPMYDFNTGYKIIHQKVLKNVLNDVKYMKQSFSSELLIRAYKKGYTIKNVKVSFLKREGKSPTSNLKALPSIVYRSLKGFVKLKIELLK